MRINYVGPSGAPGTPGAIPQVSFWEVLQAARGKRPPPQDLRGAMVLIGETGNVQKDTHPVPCLNPSLVQVLRSTWLQHDVDMMPGVEIHANTKVTGVTPRDVSLSDGASVPTYTLVWTAGTSPSPTLDRIGLPREKGKIVVDADLRVPGHPEVWALGDCALIPDLEKKGAFHPPTAQHASREGAVLARNICAVVHGRPTVPFRFRTIGLLASIGHRTGVARIMGVNFSGFVAWWLWRTIYLSKLPGFEKKVRVALEWTLDLFFNKDFVQYQRLNPARQLIPTDGGSLPLREACDEPPAKA